MALTEKVLYQHGFKAVDNEMFVNKREWLLHVAGEYPDLEHGEIINRDSTWFSGIGASSFEKDGRVGVSTLCRGNYVCRNVSTLEDLKLLYLAMTGKELEKVL